MQLIDFFLVGGLIALLALLFFLGRIKKEYKELSEIQIHPTKNTQPKRPPKVWTAQSHSSKDIWDGKSKL